MNSSARIHRNVVDAIVQLTDGGADYSFDDIRRQGVDLREVLGGESIKSGDRPRRGRGFRQHHEAGAKAGEVDLDAGVVVGGDGLILLGGGGVQFHRRDALTSSLPGALQRASIDQCSWQAYSGRSSFELTKSRIVAFSMGKSRAPRGID